MKEVFEVFVNCIFASIIKVCGHWSLLNVFSIGPGSSYILFILFTFFVAFILFNLNCGNI